MKRTVMILAVACLPHFVPAAQFFVSPDGKDINPGSKDQPLATLAGARDAVRVFRKRHPDEDVTVWIGNGTYRLTETLVFSLEDSGRQGHPITYAAAPGERPVLSGAAPVRGWTKLQSPPRGLPQAAQGKVWVADVSWVREIKQRQSRSPSVATQFDRGWRFFTLYQGGRSLPRARGPEFAQVGATQFTGKATLQEVNTTCRMLRFPPGAVKDYSGVADAELRVIPMYPWIMNLLPIQSVDVNQRVLQTAVPATYPLGRNTIGMRPTAWIENVLEVLDEPGEWVLDSQAAKLYLWPEGERPPDDIVVPVLTELVRIEGKIAYDGPQDTPVRNLVLRGLTFTQGDRFSWHGRTGWGLQHDWEMFDSPSALVRFRGAEGCAVEHCRFVCSGGTGVRLDLHAQKNRICDSEFAELGGVGIVLAGYGPGTKDVNRQNEVANNHVHHIGRLYWGSPGIIVWQSGENRIEHNTIHHAPYDGICVVGRQVWDPRGNGECARTIRWEETGQLPPALKEQFRQADRLLTASDVQHAWKWDDRQRFLHARNNLIEHNDIHHVMQSLGDGNCIYLSGAGRGNRVRENYCHDCDGREMNAAMRCDGDQHGVTFERNIVYRTGGRGEGIISKGKNDIVGN
ncbi:right-handed parallel beta-helix repeat-containing protein, partial [Candidatus Sumerlaeota bacterium]|nr:right-handed parallel beta-helix repeat-containing protein [Candidatus Sumerlaeota bacterium]